jgi:low affinity Fe/Cu permease
VKSTKLQNYYRKLEHHFNDAANLTAQFVGSLRGFMVLLLTYTIWTFVGAKYTFGQQWSTYLSTFCDVVSLFMLSVLQNTANRGSKAAQLKQDEILLKTEGADNSFIGLEERDEAELERKARKIRRELLRQEKRKRVKSRRRRLSNKRHPHQPPPGTDPQ